jgi:universal stress protein A
MKTAARTTRSSTPKRKSRRESQSRAHAIDQPVVEVIPDRLHIRRILVPTDFSESAKRALRYAQRFAEQFQAEVILVHVIEPIVYPPELGYASFEVPMVTEQALRQSATKELEALQRKLGGRQLSVRFSVRTGRPFNEIAEAARELGADLIIISTHGFTGLKHALLGSTAERVVRHAPCPVLTVREPEGRSGKS